MTETARASANLSSGRAYCLTTGDGVALPLTLYGEPAAARAAVIVNSALGVPQAYYRLFAGFLVRHGYCVITYDYRGNGGLAPAMLRGIRTSISDWAARDFAAVLDHLQSLAPALPVCCVGHSVGGQLPGLLPEPRDIKALVAVCAQSGDWRLWSGLPRLRAILQFYLAIPLLTRLLGYYPGVRFGLCNLPSGVAREWARWCRRRGYAAHPRCGHAAGFARFDGDALFISTYDDRALAPRRAVDALAALYRNARGERLHVDAAAVGGRAVGHFGFFNSATGRRLWPLVLQWLQSLPIEERQPCQAPLQMTA